ncbi:hypothetical protein EVG20_g4740 [Dentipellis fragilis]|uniref:Xylanolytic transcriptional activator regulatory domain-containing protein n=1 Tax=Dentipellis fragilis TaxID=205917 RepID=A0A4Y9YUV6_9AGAM|nr:hypothetical protein EVG20_g4740 [Dentipellis fragilis]
MHELQAAENGTHLVSNIRRDALPARVHKTQYSILNGRDEECGYMDVQVRSKTQILEDDIIVLKARIKELENPGASPSRPILLHNPHSPEQQSPTFRIPSSTTVFSQQEPSVSPGADTSPSRFTTVPDGGEYIPPETASELLDHFFAHSSQLGWFMHIGRFRSDLRLPDSDDDKPIPALVSAVYLFGATIVHRVTGSKTPVDENVLLSQALHDIGTGLTCSRSHQIVQVIQTHLLLALYHYIIGAYIEGRRQSNAAASLAISSQFHRIRSTEPSQNSLGFVDIVPLTVTESRDQVEEGERISGMWTAFAVDRCWAVALGAPAIISDDPVLGTRIDTPWPLDMETYERGIAYPDFRSNNTLQNFLAGNTSWPWENHSLMAQLTTASALFERATYSASCWKPGLSDMNAFYASFASLDQRINEFKGQLFSLGSLEGTTSDVVRTMHNIHLFAAAASIQLHSVFSQQNPGSRDQCFASAMAIVHADDTVRVHGFLVINPLLGVIWAVACHVFIGELLVTIPLGMTSPLPNREADSRASLVKLQATMAVFARNNSFISTQTPSFHIFTRLMSLGYHYAGCRLSTRECATKAFQYLVISSMDGITQIGAGSAAVDYECGDSTRSGRITVDSRKCELSGFLGNRAGRKESGQEPRTEVLRFTKS